MLKEVMLIVAILMPGSQPDIIHRQAMPSLEACWQSAHEFADRSLPDEARKRGALGLGATCAWHEKPSVEN